MQAIRLPYIDNAGAILITVAINLAAVFLFNWPGGVDYRGVVADSLFCATITTAINLWFVYSRLKKLRSQGMMPMRVPVSRLMQKLPRNPVALGILYAAVFAALAAGINAALWRFFGIRSMAFAPWAVYKLLYATLLSAKIVEYCIFRYVQPDWSKAAGEANSSPVRNPLPKISVFKEIYGSVTGNIALNLAVGFLTGGVVVGADASISIRPTTPDGIAVTGLVLGLITGILVTHGVVKAMGASPPEPVDRRFSWMPKREVALIAVVTIPLMIFSAVILRGVMIFWNLPELNFYQFILVISVYATLIGKLLAFVVTKRCAQPDYTRWRRPKKAATRS